MRGVVTASTECAQRFFFLRRFHFEPRSGISSCSTIQETGPSSLEARDRRPAEPVVTLRDLDERSMSILCGVGPSLLDRYDRVVGPMHEQHGRRPWTRDFSR